MIEEAIFRDGDAIKSISCTFTEAIHAVRILSRDRIVFKINSKKAKHGKQTYDVWHDFEDYEEIAYINSGFMSISIPLIFRKKWRACISEDIYERKLINHYSSTSLYLSILAS